MKRLVGLVLCGLLCITLAGCGNEAASPSQSGESPQSEASGTPTDDAITIEQIDYEVTSGIDNGTRRVVFGYTNNSDYAIVGLSLELALREDAESEDIEAAYDYMFELGVTEENIREGRMTCEWMFVVDPGESSADSVAHFGMYYINNIEQYDLMQPDMMTIQFLYDGKIYEEYYDYRSGTYSLSSNIIDPNQWGDGELSEAIPKPENALVVGVRDLDTQFSFDVQGMTQEQFNDYVEACKEAGFTENVTSTDSVFYADNVDGKYQVDLLWYSTGGLNAYVSYIDEG